MLDKAPHHPYDHPMLSRDGTPLSPRIVSPCSSRLWRLIAFVLTVALASCIEHWADAASARDFNWCQCAHLDHYAHRQAQHARDEHLANLTLYFQIKAMEAHPGFHMPARPLSFDPIVFILP